MKRYYIIWREGRRAGFFSIISSILGQIRYAESNDLIPVIDMENHPNIYNEKESILGTKNSFEYYFKSLQEETLEVVYSSGNLKLSEGRYPANFTMSISSDPTLRTLWNRYFILNEYTSDYIDDNRRNLKIDSRTLGIHFRGQEMRRAALHPLPMTLRQAISLTNEIMATGKYEKIFVVTEGSNYLKKFEKAFPGKVVSTNAFRSFIWNSYRLRVRKLHRYKLGLEILTDTILLSECGGLISGSSNVTEMAILLNDGQYAQNIQIRNGRNSANRLIAKFYWYFKYLLPINFGGMPKPRVIKQDG